MKTKYYLVALRSDKIGKGPSQWAQQLRGIPGVEVHETDADQARIFADERGIGRVRAMLDTDYLIEEEVGRYPSS
jgi:hypothetical protein